VREGGVVQGFPLALMGACWGGRIAFSEAIMEPPRTLVTHPSKEAVRRLLQQRRAMRSPPLSPEQIRALLGWRLILSS
jgi:hypothetical protein